MQRIHATGIAPASAKFASMVGARILFLHEDDDLAGTRRCMSNTVELAEGVERSWVTITRTGSFTDPRYGRFEITPTMLAQMVRNFDARVLGQDIFLDVDHKPGDGAAAKILALKVDNGRLRAQVEWTDFGTDAVRKRGFRYLSAEFHEAFRDNEQGNEHGCVLLGAGLTIRPVIKRLDPVTLSVTASTSGPVFVHPGLARQLTESLETIAMNRWEKFLAHLKARGIVLSEAQLAGIKESFNMGARALADDADDAAFLTQWEGIAKALAAAGSNAVVQLSVTNPVEQATPEAIAAAVQKALAEQATAAQQAATNTSARQKLFTDTLAAATTLSEQTRTQLSGVLPVITGAWTDDQVRELAAKQIAIGEQMEANRKLAQMGYSAGGSPRISVDDSNTIKSLAQAVHNGLRSTMLGHQLRLPDEDKQTPFQKKLLAAFDEANAQRLHDESKRLAGGPVESGDLSLPASYQRAVLLEATSDNRVLDLVATNVDLTAAPTHSIPYEKRDISALRNDGVVYEGQEIPPGGVSIENDYAYIVPMKISLDETNEAAYFSLRNSLINYDAWARALVSNSRVMRENVGRRIANHMQRESAAYGAVVRNAVALTESAGNPGTYRVPADRFPIVRPWQPRDLKGTAIGSEQQPMVVRVGGTARPRYDGSGTQAAGNYYRVVNYNLGLVQIVNQAGVPQPGLTITADFYQETNIVLFDLDVPNGVEKVKHLNGLIQAFGDRKARLAQDRFVQPDFALMAYTLNDEATNAEQYTAAGKRADSSVTVSGDLADIKGVGCWSTNAPGIDLGEERIIMGQRGATAYTIAKPFGFGAPFEAVGPNGRPTGRKLSYGEEFSSIHVPAEYRARFTSVVAYSATGRAA